MNTDYRMSTQRHIDENTDPELSTLDLGCAEGSYVKRFKDIVGMDINEDTAKEYPGEVMIQDARKKWKTDRKFDQILCIEMLEHIESMEDVNSILEQCSMHLKKGGSLVIHTPNRGRWTVFLKQLMGRPKKYPYYIVEQSRRKGKLTAFTQVHYREFTLSELAGLLESNGFSLDSAEIRFVDVPFINRGLDMRCSLGKALFAVARKK